MKIFFKDNKKTDVCLFFCGWGTDEHLYMPVLKDMDYVLFYDYDKALSFELPVDINKYEKKYLLCYSAGGFIPMLLKDKLPNFDMKVAVNASTKIDGKFGLSKEAIYATENINIDNFIQFRLDFMVDNEEELLIFNKNQPHRSFESCFQELDNLYYLSSSFDVYDFTFDRIFHSLNDKVIPFNNQKEFFGDKIIPIKGSHFPFYKYGSLKEFFV